MNDHDQDRLDSAIRSRTLDFATVFGCNQLVIGLTRERGETLDLLLTDGPDLVQVRVVAPLANSEHSLLSTDIVMA